MIVSLCLLKKVKIKFNNIDKKTWYTVGLIKMVRYG